MSKSDWVILRLIYDMEQPAHITVEQARALQYLLDKCGDKVVRKSILELHRSFR